MGWTSGPGIEFADFNNCVYADPAKGEQPYKKPQRFVGKIRGLASLTATCSCARGTLHPKVVGVAAAKDSAGYPISLCHAYAKLVVKQWMAGLRPTLKRPAEQPDEEHAQVIEEAQWIGGSGRFGDLRHQDTKKAKRDRENQEAIGGMRRPAWSLDHVPGLRAVGREIDLLFDEFVKKVPGAATAGERYATEGFKMNLVEEWKAALEAHFGVCSRPAGLRRGVVETGFRPRPGRADLAEGRGPFWGKSADTIGGNFSPEGGGPRSLGGSRG